MRFDSVATEREALRLYRQHRQDTTIRELAERCEVSHAWLIQWERGEISDPGIHRIGRVLEALRQ